MSKIILIIILNFPLLMTSQIEVKNFRKDNSEILPIVDSTVNISLFKKASQFLGLINQEIFALPINSGYDSKNYISFDKNFSYKTKEKIKVNDEKYKVGDYVPIMKYDFYKENIENNYFKVNEIKFVKEQSILSKEVQDLNPKEWEYGDKSRTSILLYLSNKDESINLKFKIDGNLFTEIDYFCTVSYFNYIKNRCLNKFYLIDSKLNYYIPDYYNFDYANSKLKIKEIKEEDKYVCESVNFEHSENKYQRFPKIFIILRNTTTNKELKIEYDKLNSNLSKEKLVSYQDYTDYQNKLKLDIENEEKTIYKLYGTELGEKIIAGKVELGMDRLAVRYCIGSPTRKHEIKTENSLTEQFVYENLYQKTKYYIFQDGKLVSIQD